MSKKNTKASGAAPAAAEDSGELVRLRAPKGVAAIGVPLEDGTVEQVDVPKGGVVEVERGLAGALCQQGFEVIPAEE